MLWTIRVIRGALKYFIRRIQLMKKNYLFSALVASVLYGSTVDNVINLIPDSNTTIDSNTSTQSQFAPNEAMIQFTDGTMASNMIEKMQNALGSFTHNEYNVTNAMHIIVPGKSFDQIKQLLNAMPGIKSVEKNYAQISFNSNDTYYSKLWAIENTGQSVNNKSGTKDADMDVNEAWNIEKGDKDVVVAVLDTGVDYTHNDLTDNMWGGNSKHGYDFAGDDDGNNDNDPMPDKPYDDKGHYHGTHVAGTIGAIGNNSNGVSGVAQNVQIMAVKVFRPNGYGYNSDILEGLDYVSDQIDAGVKVVAINASYGGGGGSQGDTMDEAIKNLGKKGVVFCAAAGNDGKNIDNDPTYPASYDAPNIITVAASDQDDKLASFSNYGKNTVEVAAPGTNILSTYPDNQYAYLQGTSMATPNVTGTVALLSSVNPEATVKERIDAITNNVDTKSDLTNKVSTNGRVNTYEAVKSLANNNSAPSAKNDSTTTEYETKVTIDVLKNDTDADGDTLTIKSTTNPSHGSVSVKNGKIEYAPESGFSGTDNFNYTVSDGNGGEDSATVTVTVKEKENSVPTAKDDSAKTDENKSVTIDVLNNDTDADGDKLVIRITKEPSYGKVEIINNKVKYTPNEDYNGNDSFNYVANDGKTDSNEATVSIKVDAVNDKPVAKDDSATAEYETKVTIDVLKNDSDADGDNLTIKSTTNPSHGSVSVKNGKIEYTPESGFSGTDNFNYTVSDGNGGEDSAAVTVTVKEKVDNGDDSKNNPPKANNDSATTEYETKVTIDVLKNDSDADGDTLTIKSINNPKHGTVVIKNGKVEYTPANGFSGTDNFNYTVSDGNGGEDSATVTVTVKEKVDNGDGDNSKNNPPKAKDDNVDTKYQTQVYIRVLDNDSDSDGDNLNILSVTNPKNGTVSIKNDKIIDYTPDNEFSGTDSFNYTISDGNGGTDTAQVTVLVKDKEDDNQDGGYHFPIIKEDGVESIIKMFTNFITVKSSKYTEFQLDKNRGNIKVDNNGEVELETNKAPVPKVKLPAGTKIIIDKDKMSIDFTMNQNISF